MTVLRVGSKPTYPDQGHQCQRTHPQCGYQSQLTELNETAIPTGRDGLEGRVRLTMSAAIPRKSRRGHTARGGRVVRERRESGDLAGGERADSLPWHEAGCREDCRGKGEPGEGREDRHGTQNHRG